MALFIGLDLSTQSLKVTVSNITRDVICEKVVNFHRDLPKYCTQNGAIAGPDDGEMSAPIALWIESIDIVMSSLKSAGVNFRAVAAVSGAAQQHGSIYWADESVPLLEKLDPNCSLLGQLDPNAFALSNAPIWQDSSTTYECRQLEAAAGGAQALADLTGSRAYERFTASQITKIRMKQPKAYAATRHISLVSSFLATLFLCRVAPIECSDASGMNLMSLKTLQWDETLLSACGGPDLKNKLAGEPVPGGTILGPIGRWWVERHNFSPDCIVAPFTGDNPSTIVALSSTGDAILSLGTSTTLLVSIPPPSQTVPPPSCSTSSHILAHPTTPGGSIYMLCYKNGALPRDTVRDVYSEKSWQKFSQQIESRPTGNNGLLGFYFPLKEIIPDGVEGAHFFSNGERTSHNEFPPHAHARAVVESQLLSVRARLIDTIHVTTQEKPSEGGSQTYASAAGLKRCIITGGGSRNRVLQQLVADIIGLPVFTAASGSDSAASGGALLAKYAWWRRNMENSAPATHGVSPNDGEEGTSPSSMGRRGTSFEDMCKEFGEPALNLVAETNTSNERLYGSMLAVFRHCEQVIVNDLRMNDL